MNAIWSVLLIITLFNGFYSHQTTTTEDGPKRNCSSYTRTSALKEINEEYRTKWENERIHTESYVSRMRESKNHRFRKHLEHTRSTKNNINNIDNNDNNDNDDRRNLFSEYDDQIDSEPVIIIPIVWHILYQNSDENLSDEQIESQMKVLNFDFRANNTEINDGEVDSIWSDRVGDAKIEFTLHATERKSISDSTICDSEFKMKQTSQGGLDGYDPYTYLNIWTCAISDLGYAYQPCLLGGSLEYRDGVVLNAGAVGSDNYDFNGDFYFEYFVYDEGRTATHEVGHYLNLDHIWGDDNTDSCSDSDYVSDTPAQFGSNSACPADTTNSCTDTDPETGTDLRDMYENFMDYTYDRCMFIFSEEQVWRMRAVLSETGCRSQMYTNGAQPVNQATLQPTSQPVNGNTPQPTPQPVNNNFECSDGCIVPEDALNDNICDCPSCDDESAWTCWTCSSSGCPADCNAAGITCDGSGPGVPSPTDMPTDKPSVAPTNPTNAPSDPTNAPSDPTNAPTDPTNAPSDPTNAPTDPTTAPTGETSPPTDNPTDVGETYPPTPDTPAPSEPTTLPTKEPTVQPTWDPTNEGETRQPTSPTIAPVDAPTNVPVEEVGDGSGGDGGDSGGSNDRNTSDGFLGDVGSDPVLLVVVIAVVVLVIIFIIVGVLYCRKRGGSGQVNRGIWAAQGNATKKKKRGEKIEMPFSNTGGPRTNQVQYV